MHPNNRARAIMIKPFSHYFTVFACLCLLVAGVDVFAAEPTAKGLAFFEKKIRPVLVEHCYKCHSASSEKVKGGLLLDTREGIRKGGESGHAVVPGDLKESLLISALKHNDFELPPKGRLPAAVAPGDPAPEGRNRNLKFWPSKS